MEELLALLEAGTDAYDTAWLKDPANADSVGKLSQLLAIERTPIVVSFRPGTDPTVVHDRILKFVHGETRGRELGNGASKYLWALASAMAGIAPTSPLDLQTRAPAASERSRPDYIWKALRQNQYSIEWNTPRGRPVDRWGNFTWTGPDTTPTYRMRRHHMWSLIVGRARSGPITVPDRHTLAIGGVRLRHGGGGAAPEVTYMRWTYGTNDPVAADGLPVPTPPREVDLEQASGAQFGTGKDDKQLGVYYIFLDPLDMPTHQAQIYVGKATPNIRFRVFDVAGHFGAIENLARTASAGGDPALPHATLLIDLAMLWVAMNNSGSWAGVAAAVVAQGASDEADLPGLEKAHVKLRHSHDMQFGLNKTRGG
ncbi:MAG: hypothetical protein M0R22_04290 [Dehalococcoidia bacterium]|nr:hypothetical protein [Dehalococcoidia bacterium]